MGALGHLKERTLSLEEVTTRADDVGVHAQSCQMPEPFLLSPIRLLQQAELGLWDQAAWVQILLLHVLGFHDP